MAENAISGPWAKYASPTVDAVTPSPSPTPGAKAAGPWAKYAAPSVKPAQPIAENEHGSFIPEVGKGLAAGAVNVTGTGIKSLAIPNAYDPAEHMALKEVVTDFERIPLMTNTE